MLGNLAVTEEYLPVAFGNLDHSCELVRARLRGILPRALTALPQKTFNSWTTVSGGMSVVHCGGAV